MGFLSNIEVDCLFTFYETLKMQEGYNSEGISASGNEDGNVMFTHGNLPLGSQAICAVEDIRFNQAFSSNCKEEIASYFFQLWTRIL